jgi:hypothetical protein
MLSLCLNVMSCRRRVDFNLVEHPTESLSDDDLASYVAEFRRDDPHIGESMTAGLLRSRGYRVTRARIRQALRSHDPLSAALRWPGLTKRRVYSVAGPNSLWHVGMYLSNYIHVCALPVRS